MNKFEEQIFREMVAKAQAERERAEVELETARVIQARERAISETLLGKARANILSELVTPRRKR